MVVVVEVGFILALVVVFVVVTVNIAVADVVVVGPRHLNLKLLRPIPRVLT